MLPTYRSFTGCLRVSAMKLYLRVSAMTPIQGLIAPYYFDRPTWDMRKELENPHIRAPSRPPKSVASAYLQQRFIDEPGPGENTPVEERCIVGLWFDPNAGREGSWVAETRRLDETVDAEIVEYHTGPSMKRLMERYCFCIKTTNPRRSEPLTPGSSRSNTFADLFQENRPFTAARVPLARIASGDCATPCMYPDGRRFHHK
mmetsp:Transcript_11594/g.30286  ORF Transcript_11594/g.30286 Transcript_11594/m.30286 type:complete len:202 (-) Transcript_11594:819-1424(-)